MLTHVQVAQQLMFGVSSNKMAFVLQVLGGWRGHVLIIGGERIHCPKVREWCVGHKWQAGLMSGCQLCGNRLPVIMWLDVILLGECCPGMPYASEALWYKATMKWLSHREHLQGLWKPSAMKHSQRRP